MRDHGKIVGDEDVGEAEVALQFGKQIEHVAANGHIQRRDHLVAHDQFRLERQRSGNHHTRLLAAGKLVRVALADFLRQADAIERLPRLFQPLRLVPTRARSSGSSTEARIVMRGFSAAFGSWKMIW